MQNQNALGILPLPKDVKNKGGAFLQKYKFSSVLSIFRLPFFGFKAKLVVPLPGS